MLSENILKCTKLEDSGCLGISHTAMAERTMLARALLALIFPNGDGRVSQFWGPGQ